MSDDALGKVGTLEESAHRYGGLSRPRRRLHCGQDFSKALHGRPRPRTTTAIVDQTIKHRAAASQVTPSSLILPWLPSRLGPRRSLMILAEAYLHQ
jgi:hypothetical protein